VNNSQVKIGTVNVNETMYSITPAALSQLNSDVACTGSYITNISLGRGAIKFGNETTTITVSMSVSEYFSSDAQSGNFMSNFEVLSLTKA
jgi:hypothetical protein